MKFCNKFLLLYSLLFSGSALAFSDVDFDHSSGLDLMRQYSAKYSEPDADLKLKQLKDNYERLKPSKIKSNSSPIIPKIIHQVWLGPASIPQNYRYYLKTWSEYNPDWQIKLWTEKEVLKENFASMDLYWLARSYQERSDIIRYEVLKKYGGLYIDTDIECFANFNDLNHKYDFYTNFEPPAINKKKVSILNAMIGSVPNHPIIIETLAQIRKDWYKVEDSFNDNYSRSKSSFARSNHHLAVQRTMYPFADSVFKFLNRSDLEKYKTIILPSGYNVPVYFINDVPIINFLSRIFRDKAKLSNQIRKQPETMSIHFHDKENSLMHDDYFANSLFDHSEIKGMTYMLLNLRDKYYLAFRKLFQYKFPSLIQYSPETIIPKAIYIDNSNELSEKDLENLKSQWQKLNPMFSIKTINKEELKKLIPAKLDSISESTIKLIARFYLLKEKGGVYVSSNFKPADLLEFNHKYGYYGKLVKLKKMSDKINLDLDIIASISNHSILHNMLSRFEEIISYKKEIKEETIKKLYLEYVYRYYELDGASMLFPEMYFNQKR